MNSIIQVIFLFLQISMANSENALTNSSFDAPVESSKASTSSKRYFYHQIPHPNQVPNYKFEEIPMCAAIKEEEVEGHFVDTSDCRAADWSKFRVNESHSMDFTKVDWLDWINHVQYPPKYEVSDDYGDLNHKGGLSSHKNKYVITYSLYNVACARKMFAFSHLLFPTLHGSIPFKNFC